MGVGAWGAVCGAGEVSLTIRDWTDTQASAIVTATAVANITDATCYVCDSAGNSACTTTTAVAATNGV